MQTCSIPLALFPMHDGFSWKRRRLTSQALPLLPDELHGRLFTHRNFLADFIHHGPWALSDAQAINYLALLSQDSPTKGIIYDPINDNYCCTPPSFSDRVFLGWFCDMVLAIMLAPYFTQHSTQMNTFTVQSLEGFPGFYAVPPLCRAWEALRSVLTLF
ncbi:hypothetical protein BGX38DRAFT_1202326 [Terfezia claveryi]|nr:hypothetical protein BGX38DRAFT_1202326 [Terfezia claveryi]